MGILNSTKDTILSLKDQCFDDRDSSKSHHKHDIGM